MANGLLESLSVIADLITGIAAISITILASIIARRGKAQQEAIQAKLKPVIDIELKNEVKKT